MPEALHSRVHVALVLLSTIDQCNSCSARLCDEIETYETIVLKEKMKFSPGEAHDHLHDDLVSLVSQRMPQADGVQWTNS